MKKKKKKNSCSIILFFSIIILILMAVIALILTDVITLNDNTIKNNDSSIKLDESKDFIYKANYNYDNKYKEYDRKNVEKDEDIIINNYGFEIKYKSKTQSLSDLVVPHININTMDAINVNNEIEDLYINYAKEFDECASDKNEIGCVEILTYYSYNYDNILSLVIVDGISQEKPVVFNYLTYNFDLETGNLLTYDEVLEKLGYSKDDAILKVEKGLENHLNKNYANMKEQLNSCKFTLGGEEKTDTCYNASKFIFEEEVENNEVLFFINQDGILNILAIPYFDDVENGNVHRYLFEIKK